jgi:SprT protein
LKRGLKVLFLFIIFLGISILYFNFQKNIKWQNGNIPKEIVVKIKNKSIEIETLIKQKYRILPNFPVVISDDLPTKIFGATTFDGKNIEILLNRKRLKESLDYMLNDVLPHEYAHALVFHFRVNGGKDGHNHIWQEFCINLNGVHCEKYVNTQDLIFKKILPNAIANELN